MEPTFEPARTMALLWALFGATHIGLATRRPRAALVRRFGEWGFALAFSLVAAVAFATLVTWYALHRGEGAAWPGLATVPWVRAVAIGAIVVGASLIGGALVVYSGSPMSLQHEDVKPPMGLARITRHGFSSG